jgi:hypothetical protein
MTSFHLSQCVELHSARLREVTSRLYSFVLFITVMVSVAYGYTCDRCGGIYTRRYGLKRHVITVYARRYVGAGMSLLLSAEERDRVIAEDRTKGINRLFVRVCENCIAIIVTGCAQLFAGYFKFCRVIGRFWLLGIPGDFLLYILVGRELPDLLFLVFVHA